MPNIRAPYVRAEFERAAWSAFRDGVVTSILDEHGVIARIVPRDKPESVGRVLTMSQLDELATLLRAVQAGALLRHYPDGVGAGHEATYGTYTLRAFANKDGSLYSNDADVRDAYVWMSGMTEHFIPVSEMLTAIDNASTGNDGLEKPMAVIQWEGTL